MEAVTGVFSSQSDAQRAVEALRLAGVAGDKITLLTPGDIRGVKRESESVPVDTTEQPGIGKAIGAVVGAAAGLSGGGMLLAALVPGVGIVSAAGLLGAAILGAAGAAVGGATGGALENSTTEGLPDDEIFVYEDALRKGRSVVVVLAEDSDGADRLRGVIKAEGAEELDAARQQWWIGLRSAEQEHYSTSDGNSTSNQNSGSTQDFGSMQSTGSAASSGKRNFNEDEKFYRMGFEAALHARNRCKEFDQVSAEMANSLEELQREYPDTDLEGPYMRGYQRGREYYQRMCKEPKAA